MNQINNDWVNEIDKRMVEIMHTKWKNACASCITAIASSA